MALLSSFWWTGADRNAADGQEEQGVVVAKNKSHLNIYLRLVLVHFQKY